MQDLRTLVAARTRECLAQVAAPERSELILQDALLLADTDDLPGDGPSLLEFVRGPLRTAVEAALGTAASDAVATELEAELGTLRLEHGEPVESGLRRRKARRRGDATQRTLVIASRSEERAQALASYFPDAIPIVIRDLFSLMQIADAHRDVTTAVVIDDSIPGLRGPVVRTMTGLLTGCVVVGWGLARTEGEWIALGAGEPISAVAERLASVWPMPASGVVVVADADPVWTRIVSETLERQGYEVFVARNGEAAIDAVLLHAPDVVVTDLRTPALDGVGLAERLTEMLRPPPAIVLATDAVELPPLPPAIRAVHRKDRPIAELTATVELLDEEPWAPV